MEGTKVEINFMKFDNTTNDLNRGDYFITKYDPTRLYLFLNKKMCYRCRNERRF